MATSPDAISNITEKMKTFLSDGGIMHQGYVEYKGRKFIAATRDCLERLEDWEMPENSVVISSFPKTGTTWTVEIVRHLLYGRDEDALKRAKAIPMPMLLLEMGTAAKFDCMDQLPVERKFFCTHLPEDMFNYKALKKSKSKMIYIYRNPKDQAVSWFHFAKKIPISEELRKELGEEWNEFYTNHVNGRHSHGCGEGKWYPDHILGWLKHREDENFLLLEYEAMKKDAHKEIRRIAKFLEVDLADEDVKQIEHNCSLGSMQKAAEVDPTGFLKLNVRKGKSGGWKDMLTVAQSELMDSVMKEKMAGSGIDFTYVL